MVASALADQWRVVRDTTAVGATLQRMTPRGMGLPSTRATPRIRRSPRPPPGGAAVDVPGLLRGCVEDVVGQPIDLDAPLVDLGIDSITWVEIRNCMQAALGIPIDITAFVEAFSTRTLAEHLQRLMNSSANEGGGAASARLATARALTVATSPAREQAAASSPPVAVTTLAAASELAQAFTRTLRARVEPQPAVRPLFLGAPAFGDGSLAYMSLSKALESELPGWNQSIFTLERDTETPWPELAAAHALHMLTLQPQGPYVLGGHSLGGLLGLETAVCLEQAGNAVGVVLLMDSSHPQQFKVEWMDASDATGEDGAPHDAKAHALTQLTIMMKALAFNFEEVGWDALTTDEKFRIFEDLSYQARAARAAAAGCADSALTLCTGAG